VRYSSTVSKEAFRFSFTLAIQYYVNQSRPRFQRWHWRFEISRKDHRFFSFSFSVWRKYSFHQEFSVLCSSVLAV